MRGHRFVYACNNGDMNKIQEFIDRGIDVNVGEEELKQTGLHCGATSRKC